VSARATYAIDETQMRTLALLAQTKKALICFWRKRFRVGRQLQLVRLNMKEWNEEAGSGDMRVWRNSHEDVLSLAVLNDRNGLPDLSNETAVRQWARSIAEGRAAGLIEMHVGAGVFGLIYKRLVEPAHVFTGMLLMPYGESCFVWTAVARECGITGAREAIVTYELLQAGKLTLHDYECSWAQDPYDASYRGVDRSALRFVSDDECYDERFPEHPLSKIRRILATLPLECRLSPLA
jgi:hypothetical protein